MQARRRSCFRQRGEQGHALQVVGQGPLAIDVVQHLPRRAVALQHVQHVAADLQHLRVFHRHDRGRARVVAHAGHLAEDHVFRRALGDGRTVAERLAPPSTRMSDRSPPPGRWC